MGAISSSQSQQLGASLKGITAEVERWCGSVGVNDDLSLLALEVTASAINSVLKHRLFGKLQLSCSTIPGN